MPEVPSLKNLYSGFGKIPEKQNKFLQTLGQPHIDSFNFMLKSGLDLAVNDLVPVEFQLEGGDVIKLSIEGCKILMPAVPSGTIGVKSTQIYPTECRQSATTYKGRVVGHLKWWINGQEQSPIKKDFGEIPIMLKSDACHLSKMSPKELISHKEHENEWGGYFIVKGHERLIRMLLQQRRNYPIAVTRSTWRAKDACFSDMGILLKSVREDESSNNNALHYVTDGTAKLRIALRRNLYYIPVVLIIKCLADVTDEFIYDQIMAGHEDDLYFKGCVLNMLRQVHDSNVHTHADAVKYFGSNFRVRLLYDLPAWSTDQAITEHVLRKTVCIHLDDNMDKVNLLVMMIQKLLTFAQGKCRAEGVDGVMMQEILLGGHVYLQLLKERLQGSLSNLRLNIEKRDLSKAGLKLTAAELQNQFRKVSTLESSISTFLATGNIPLSGLNLPQDKGLTIVVENINRMRYMSHFRAVHRGSFFQEMRTTEARQLLPDAWGFICPVHTPDGTPCGLLNHLSRDTEVTRNPDPALVKNIPTILSSLGMLPLHSPVAQATALTECSVVMLDGRVLGHVHQNAIGRLVDKLRVLKIKGEKVPNTLEIAHVPMKSCKGTQYPGLFLFTGPARMMRPVINLACKQVELIGTFEQVYLDVCITPAEAYKGRTTHMEISKTAFLSNLACLIPMPDLNQSPRNMYQCQMGKQTMGTPCHTFDIQAETKLYRLQTPTSPLFRPSHYDEVSLDDYGMGTNAIVAVISYTGYDMEDAMIVNKASLERGLAAGSMIKTDFYELPTSDSYFARDPDNKELPKYLDADGLVYPGTRLTAFTPICCYYDNEKKDFHIVYYKSKEEGWVQSVRQCGSMSSSQPAKANINYTVQRNPSVGDKFASRAGQKGILSAKWPSEDLPFTESGLVPDIVFNPHGFPSRMTIAMMVEIMAGKAAAVHGFVQDATPFRFTEDDTAIDYCGRLLEAAGYNYYGTEKMYSGIDGREMNASIFFGVVHYQRLRHMVSDKWQVRSTGPVDAVTHQPVKGRRRGGGVRFGEMERDGLLSHGASFLLQDRLFHCSDKAKHKVCRICGTLLGPYFGLSDAAASGRVLRCRLCEDKGDVATVEIPHIYKYLVAQMVSMNINLKMELSEEK
ncbi:DNA-directed RNA polymerase I subunit RPA2 [Thrips palmi]|uniref:DNA-directed RNA polymerase subunit beta n=1 Tax=Thrips palmi TaxID=161013 RepID=A0A6P9AFS1_THRPL|nr:DNA-directed RNA polymerase I subunit RPA2 [Thrips palmi]